MSALNGIFHWSGQPVSPSDLSILADYSRVSGPHGDGCATPREGLALQAHLLRFDRWSSQEQQPFTTPDKTVVTFDGRLDNREDLLAILHHHLPVATDVAIVAEAYRRWGLECFSRLVGDWCLALWDHANDRLVLATDYMRNRPLYYREVPEGLVWATRLEALVECFQLYGEPNEQYLIGSLSGGVPSDISPFASVRMLRGGHRLVASGKNGIEIRRYWTFSPARIRYRDGRQYTEQLRAVMTEAVRVRLRANRPVWSHLSGGWDSGTIVCLANSLVRYGHVDAPELRTLYLRFLDAEADEQKYVDAIARWCRLTPFTKNFSGLPEFPNLPSDCFRFDRGRYLLNTLEEPVRAHGDHIVLTGDFGDTIMMRGCLYPPPPLEALHEGHLMEFFRLCALRARSRKRSLWTTLAWIMLANVAPVKRYAQLFAWMYPENAAASRRPPLAPSVQARAPLPEASQIPDLKEFPFIKRTLVASLYQVAGTLFTSTPDHSPWVWRTYPYAHRPLVEFVLAAPMLAFWHPTEMRMGMQRAFPGVLPPEILARQSKMVPTASFMRERQRRYQETGSMVKSDRPLDEWELVRRGILASGMLKSVIANLGQNAAAVDQIDKWFEFEAWLRNLAGLAARPARREARQHGVTAGPVAVA